jgi:hypothetical protein
MVRQGFIILSLFLLFGFYAQISFAQIEGVEINKQIEGKDSVLENNATDSAQATIEEEVQYELAYPGMLPDNPLYFLKTFRDAVVKFLISDPLKAAEFNVLTANKRAYAALLLAQKQKGELAMVTLSKSNNYLHEAVVSLSKAKEKKMDIGSILDRLDKSVKKHRQVFSQQIMPIIPESLKKDLEREINRLSEIEKSAYSLTAK